jgi:uncharacterized protein YecT (DUF1311 family)
MPYPSCLFRRLLLAFLCSFTAASAQAPPYDPAIFLKPVPTAEMDFVKQLAGKSSGDVIKDKQFRKLMKNFVPDCMFHYGRDMPLQDALEMALERSPLPSGIRDGRYFMIAGEKGPYLAGRAFLWIDLQTGIGAGAFFFHPTNGEPTPTVAVFARQVREKAIGLSDLPPAFADDLIQWTAAARIPPVTTRYFLTGNNKRILLEHDEDFCLAEDGSHLPADSGCEQRNADAADIDVNTAYYLEQIHYATNGTAWMVVGANQSAWMQVRDNACRVGPDLLGCRIRVSHEHVRVISQRPIGGHPPVHAGRR